MDIIVNGSFNNKNIPGGFNTWKERETLIIWLWLVIRLDIIRKIWPHSSETILSSACHSWQNGGRSVTKPEKLFWGKSLWSLFPLMFIYILSYLFIFDMISTGMEISDASSASDTLKKKKSCSLTPGSYVWNIQYSISQLARLKVISSFLSNMHKEVSEWTEVFWVHIWEWDLYPKLVYA